MKKIKNNDEMLIELIKTNSPVLNALLRERIVTFMEITKKEIEGNPEKFWFIDSSMYLNLCKNVNDKIGFNN
jgi:hypothetical protein